ncbi:hypothetical protein BACCIP111895_03874 [Neobacillus rhizosphaerae]|uniref:Uncharacterized protein n=1 Tax=Neobacillus rhizosphaerae TaxID=2880965 RepID=A0ABM9EVG7_9BACI|nr:hypothetical protein [Neobacillus rhizosphaerae]CAH2716686.1 hypothetical protein BACCIP111895_03874 [Neobacillus rhizosphaerae]
MEEALLHGGVVNIEARRMELEEQNLSRSEIRRQLTTQYRAFSKKKAFTCPCCDEPVNMNLTVYDGRLATGSDMSGEQKKAGLHMKALSLITIAKLKSTWDFDTFRHTWGGDSEF